ncbi:DUF2975 domain-containing protein [Stackebrandtia endophytica]|nr:DUF2975 domain-containing protein [Stackebrandtia endophytica]
MSKIVIALLRTALAGAVLIGLFATMVIIPGAAEEEVARVPAYAPYQALYVTVAILAVLGILVAISAVWMLLSMVGHNTIFTPRAFRWVDVVIGGTGFATLLAAGVTVHLMFVELPVDDGMQILGAMLATAACTGLGAVFLLLTIVMRQLLKKATNLQAEMAQVV